MSSKFQNRLIGAIVIIAVTVIVFPILFDGNKKYNETKFSAIPLMPESRDTYEIEPIAPINIKSLKSSLKSMPETIISDIISDFKDKSGDNIFVEHKKNSKLPIEIKKLVLSASEQTTKLNNSAKVPHGRFAYVIQLGALKNASKVKEIIIRLRLSGYNVYTEPLLPINGQITRIFINLNATKEKLHYNLSELKDLTGLQGQIHGYKP
ncbi:MAG: cell division protein DedD [Arsenophonus sp.]